MLMSPAEARGYIRARSADVADSEAAAALSKLPRGARRYRPQLTEAVRTTIVDALTAEIVRAQRTGQRRAAA
jgi:hypothetical protein